MDELISALALALAGDALYDLLKWATLATCERLRKKRTGHEPKHF